MTRKSEGRAFLADQLLRLAAVELRRLSKLACECVNVRPTLRIPCLACCAKDAKIDAHRARLWIEGKK